MSNKVVGTCPLCGKQVLDLGLSYTCEDSHWDRESYSVVGCPFTFWKHVGGKAPWGIDITEEHVSQLLANEGTGYTDVVELVSHKEPHKHYLVKLYLDLDAIQEQEGFPVAFDYSPNNANE